MAKRTCGKSVGRTRTLRSTESKRVSSVEKRSCGGLKTICRPRFFAGQLLTEDDLNRLDCYIRQKNRLHNRYVHGWGVVCGLEVGCHDCEERAVTVSPGYAINPCGDDIIVESEDVIDVCEKIENCLLQERKEADCRPYKSNTDCSKKGNAWVLAISYAENPADPVTALKRKAPLACEPSVICEQYTYDVFRLPVTDPSGKEGIFGGPLVDRMSDCLKDILDAWIEHPTALRYTVVEPSSSGNNTLYLNSAPGAVSGHFALVGSNPAQQEIIRISSASGQQIILETNLLYTHAAGESVNIYDPVALHDWCCLMKRMFEKQIRSKGSYECTRLDDLSCLVCPAPTLDAHVFYAEFATAYLVIMEILVKITMDCICSAMLPPCPEGEEDLRVPLAVITVNPGECAVLKVCNWTTLRKMLITVPNMRYWLSPLQMAKQVRELCELFCCTASDMIEKIFGSFLIKDTKDDNAEKTHLTNKKMVKTDASIQEYIRVLKPENLKSIKDFSQIAANAFSGQAMTSASVLRSMKGEKLTENDRILENVERKNLTQYAMLNLMARPIAEKVISTAAAGGIITKEKANSIIKPAGASSGDAVKEEASDSIKTRMKHFEALIEKQNRKIEALSDQLKSRNSG